ncbi:hypothetical protein BBK36DRAFT_1120693 [Trichoderma citrinoviride]|uniref:Fork-head domain-containing protein n=1 Tax=Trichoderma citrinoviride TaxID=58853 RepID=A0A2T4B9M2_9HYPO|nr:hypothetical protein BBK36DRAFT_1120693 [Trichoderma citrinoviride]PTB66027.1 hypothetical protein BBK36DRAFT_1120693 [Trichoderma citrinoviride]
MALQMLERKLPVDSYTDFRHPQQTEQQSCLMACCSPAALSTLPSDFGQQGQQQHHQPDTCSFPPTACALPQEEQQRHHQQQQQQQPQNLQDQHGRRILSSPPVCCSDAAAAGAYMSPYLSSYQQPRSQNIWPSPPLGPGDIQSCTISFQDSPVCGSARLPYYTTSPASPSGWSSASVSGYPPNTTTTTALFDPRNSGDQTLFRLRTPMSAQELPAQHHQPDMSSSTSYTPGFGAGSDADVSAGLSMSVTPSDAMVRYSTAPPARLPDFGSEALRRRMPRSPVMSRVTPRMRMRPEKRRGRAKFLESIGDEVKPVLAPVSVPVDVITVPDYPVPTSSAVGHDEKTDEPYAKLIYRALMSAPDYTMSLQEIYQWFRENTTKAKNEKGGWQNSIRHNLSMNGAFERCDRKLANGQEPSTCAEKAGESKRTNLWRLAESAIGKGVQSTTRYRKGNSGRRASRRSASTSQPAGDVVRGSQRSSIKALSGQKGGHAARNARVRSHLYGQGLSLADGRQYRLIESGLGSPPPSSMPDGYYSMPIAIPRIDPAAIQAPMAAHGHDFGSADAASDLFGLQMGPRSSSHGGGGDISVSYMGHHHHQQEEPLYTPPFPYGIADVQVQLDYPGEDPSGDIGAQLRRYEALTGTPRVGWASPNGI